MDKYVRDALMSSLQWAKERRIENTHFREKLSAQSARADAEAASLSEQIEALQDALGVDSDMEQLAS